MKTVLHSLKAISFSVICLLPAIDEAAATELQERISELTTEVSTGRIDAIGGIRLTSRDFIAELYSIRGNEPIWQLSRHREELFREIEEAERHGFRPEDFKLEQLAALDAAASSGDAKEKAEFEVAGTEILARLLHHLYFGKVDPKSLDPSWTFGRAFAAGDPAGLVNQYLNVASIEALVDETALRHPAYLRLQEALARYRTIKAKGGWPQVPEGTVLRPGKENDAVRVLRRRLAVTGDYQGAQGEGPIYDEAFSDVVKSFQTRHGLAADGVVGPRTFRALNRPVEERIDQLRASLERARWLFRDIEDDFVLVNIGGPETYLVQNGRLVWKARSIVGRSYRQTPVFRDDIRYMEFNPTWTVPFSIFRNDKLPLIRRDRRYLSRGNYTVLNSNGRPINPASVNWSGTPRVTLRQEPGPWNAMGLVKFMFPNAHSVYLHDTDNRNLFDRNERNLSSGCVRIENPFEFADHLMKNDPDWSAERREAILASGRTTRVNLPSPMPVLLTYFTAWLDEAGNVQFREDLYERDDKVISALNAAFSG